MNAGSGYLVISLDFEMMWGCHDWATVDGYGSSNIRNVRQVISRMLQLFDKYNVHATFATVGLIMCDDKKDAILSIPSELPTYKNKLMSPYRTGFMDGITEELSDLFFAPDVVELLKNSPGIEIGTHTYGHYYCWEEGQTVAQFKSDIVKAVEKANEKVVKIKSIVFPKNNVSEEYLNASAEAGLSVYRGNPAHLFGQVGNKFSALLQKTGRLLDSYIPLTKNTYTLSSVDAKKQIINIPASRFLRPYSRSLHYFDWLQVRRINREIVNAAKHGEVYHLWWHPHNFGKDIDANFNILEKILRTYTECAEMYKMKSLNMNELCNIIKSENSIAD